MSDAIRGLDHALIGVSDLAAARARWERLGFTLTPMGRHTGRPTGNHCIMFQDDYVELIGIVDPDGAPSRLSGLLEEKGEGLIGAALAAEAEAARASFAAAGLNPSEVQTLVRPTEGGEARFSLVDLPPEETPEFRFFVCEHHTPELVRNESWLSHPNGATGLQTLTLVSPDADPLEEPFAKLFGAERVELIDDVLLIKMPRQRVVIVNPFDLEGLYPDLDMGLETSAAPRGVALRFATGDIEASLAWLQKAGHNVIETADGAIQIAPEDANGVLLEFVEP